MNDYIFIDPDKPGLAHDEVRELVRSLRADLARVAAERDEIKRETLMPWEEMTEKLRARVEELEADLTNQKLEAARELFRKADARVKELEDCLREIERRLREDTGPILDAVRVSGSREAAKAWKHAVYASAVRAQVFLHSEVKMPRDALARAESAPAKHPDSIRLDHLVTIASRGSQMGVFIPGGTTRETLEAFIDNDAARKGDTK